ncbi:hypothetical protein [Dendrosporobacter sp. 1207_IL3150]|uniref:hypothetical protein n=1 Tax=Dendrosporobacter sp. 1207_IL3150 TaxID=3084054 RepID=UPI002FD99D3A
MKRRLVNGLFSSIPDAELMALAMSAESEEETATDSSLNTKTRDTSVTHLDSNNANNLE